ncbi:MAG: hypothetical protein M0Z51_16225 [Propionibacterium sp.]|nr:hypothetical protein [Propionibacterium sp.]
MLTSTAAATGSRRNDRAGRCTRGRSECQAPTVRAEVSGLAAMAAAHPASQIAATKWTTTASEMSAVVKPCSAR